MSVVVAVCPKRPSARKEIANRFRSSRRGGNKPDGLGRNLAVLHRRTAPLATLLRGRLRYRPDYGALHHVRRNIRANADVQG